MKYSIKELESLCSVSARTIRYYISNNILPPPEGAGRGAFYTSLHLERLTLIQDMVQNQKMSIEQVQSFLDPSKVDTAIQNEEQLLKRVQNAIGRDMDDRQNLIKMAGLSTKSAPIEPENWVRMQLHQDGIEISLKRWIYEAYSHEIRKMLNPLMEEIGRIDALKNKALNNY